MNKTININLAGTFFHIDEDAYLKLQNYLDVIKRFFTNSQGKDEIISDIEARIAELFIERVQHDKQVVNNKHVEEVITIMGQPEDYIVDDEIFDDEPKTKKTYDSKTHKKLFRDTENQYIGGVSSGLAHYVRMDAIWIRLAWILLTVFSWGGFVFIYILLWILVPEASTTAQKIAMTGDPVNISNIEKKIKEGLDDVADRVKNVDYEKIENNVKTSSRTFFGTIKNIIKFILKGIGKFIGIIILIVASSTLISLFIGMFTVGTIDFIHSPWSDFIQLTDTTGVPIWILSILSFLAIGIPFLFLFILGLKMLIKNLKSIGNSAKYSLITIWAVAICGLITIGIKQYAQTAHEATLTQKHELKINTTDTLNIKIANSFSYDDRYDNNNFDIIIDDTDNQKLYIEDVKLNIKPASDSISSIKIRKSAEGSSYREAKQRAEEINYIYTLEENTLKLDDFLLTDFKNKYRDQEVTITLYLPENTIIYLNKNLRSHIGSNTPNDQDFYRSSITKHTWKIGEDELICLDCIDETEDEEDSDEEGININEDGININIKNDDDEEFNMKIDENGIKINTNNN